MSLDKANSKLLVEIKKLHCQDSVPGPGPVAATIDDLDLVNGGDTAEPSGQSNPTKQESAADDGPAYDLCWLSLIFRF